MKKRVMIEPTPSDKKIPNDAKINIRGIIFDNLNFEETINLILSRYDSNTSTVIFTPNSEILQLCIDDHNYSDIINSADLIIPDGIGVIKASHILGTPLKAKTAGIEIGEKIVSLSGRYGFRIF